jgi:hypothetical protein
MASYLPLEAPKPRLLSTFAPISVSILLSAKTHLPNMMNLEELTLYETYHKVTKDMAT